MQSPATDQESVFTDDESLTSNKPSVNWETFPRPSDSSIEGELPKTLSARKFTKPDAGAPPPPRPPKPLHLVLNSPSETNPSETNKSPSNSEPEECPLISDETYDFPRSHQMCAEEGQKEVENTSRHCYTNAAPGRVQGDVFR